MTEGRLQAASCRVLFDASLFTFGEPAVPRTAVKSGLCSFSPVQTRLLLVVMNPFSTAQWGFCCLNARRAFTSSTRKANQSDGTAPPKPWNTPLCTFLAFFLPLWVSKNIVSAECLRIFTVFFFVTATLKRVNFQRDLFPILNHNKRKNWDSDPATFSHSWILSRQQCCSRAFYLFLFRWINIIVLYIEQIFYLEKRKNSIESMIVFLLSSTLNKTQKKSISADFLLFSF